VLTNRDQCSIQFTEYVAFFILFCLDMVETCAHLAMVRAVAWSKTILCSVLTKILTVLDSSSPVFITLLFSQFLPNHYQLFQGIISMTLGSISDLNKSRATRMAHSMSDVDNGCIVMLPTVSRTLATRISYACIHPLIHQYLINDFVGSFCVELPVYVCMKTEYAAYGRC
jgi:hypothetical protein